MSRVHDALKRAEQKRALYKGVGIEEVPEPISTAGPIPVAPSSDTATAEAAEPMASTLDPSAGAALLASCFIVTWRPDTKTMLFFSSEEPDHGTEEFRTLRSRLYQLRETKSLRKLLIASSLPGEGRSFVAANLAQVMALQPGCRVLLIDADLRSPGLYLPLGTSATPGLSEYLLGEAEEFGIIQRGQMENLFFIPSGRHVSGQTELVSNGRLRLLLDCMEPLFDWIVIDSPAAMPVSDSGLVAKLCDGVLMVVRCNSTPIDVVRKASQRFLEEKLVGIVLNGIPVETLPTQYY
jgi:protein-tyrosine kinase